MKVDTYFFYLLLLGVNGWICREKEGRKCRVDFVGVLTWFLRHRFVGDVFMWLRGIDLDKRNRRYITSRHSLPSSNGFDEVRFEFQKRKRARASRWNVSSHLFWIVRWFLWRHLLVVGRRRRHRWCSGHGTHRWGNYGIFWERWDDSCWPCWSMRGEWWCLRVGHRWIVRGLICCCCRSHEATGSIS